MFSGVWTMGVVRRGRFLGARRLSAEGPSLCRAAREGRGRRSRGRLSGSRLRSVASFLCLLEVRSGNKHKRGDRNS